MWKCIKLHFWNLKQVNLMRHQMQREHAQIMKITNVFFNPISAFAQTNLIIELKLTVYLFSKKLGTDQLTSQGGGYGFFLNKYSDSQCYWRKYSDFGGGKTKSVSECLSCNLMLNFGEKKIVLCATKNKYYNSHVVREKFSEWSKNHNPPSHLQVKWLVP
jgi:hypothetical protein